MYIMPSKIEDIFSYIQNIKKEDKELIEKAYIFAKKAHQ